MYFFLPFLWLRVHHVNCKLMSTNKCFAANNILLMHNNYIICLCVKMADQFPEQAESDLTYLVDKKNGDRMIKYCALSVH